MAINENGVQVERQYIGARYVPKFFQGVNGSPEWVSGLAYEALTIVTYLGNSFTSKVPVPAGIGNPADNPGYWVNTGNYNAQVDAYREEVAGVKNDVVGVQNNLNTEIQNREDQYNTLSNRLNTNALYFGNSYCDGYGTEAGNGLFNLTKNYFTYSKLYSSGGCGFNLTAQSTQTFEDLLDTAITEIQNPSEITHIIIISAIGDSRAVNNSTPAATWKNKIASFVSKAKTTFSNAVIWLATCDTIEINGKANIRQCDIYYCYEMFKSLAPINGYTYLGWCGWDTCNLGSEYSYWQDGYHPSKSGNEILKNNLLAAFKGMFNYKEKSQLFRYNNSSNWCWLYGTPDTVTIKFNLMPEIVVNNPSSLPTPFINLDTAQIQPSLWFASTTAIQQAFVWENNTLHKFEVETSDLGRKLHAIGSAATIPAGFMTSPIIIKNTSNVDWMN